MLPSTEEIESLLGDKSLTTIIFFLDETFEELKYDITTTVSEAVEYVAGVIKLENYSTFTLYECRKVLKQKENVDYVSDEHILLDDNKYIADILQEFKGQKQVREGV